MIKSEEKLPNSDELLDADDLPVDNELQTLIPNLLSFILGFIWSERMDWFFGINMGIYHTTGLNYKVPIVPDAFLSLGVERIKNNQLRKSYVVWEENNIVPIFTLEVVSQTPGGEYDEKMSKYAKLGVLYYIIYNPEFWLRDRHEPFEVYRLVDGKYERQLGEPFFMGEIGLGIGRGMGFHKGYQQEWLYWYDRQGTRYDSPEEIAILAEQEAAKLKALLARYRQQFGDLPES